MRKTDFFTRALAVVGTALAWFPIAATVLTSVGSTLGRGAFHLDWLMPAELFPAAAIGGVLLLWAALRARTRVKPIAWSLALMVVVLVGGQALAVVTGLATGEAEPEGWPMVMLGLTLAGYTLLLAVIAVTGALLVRDVFKSAADMPR